jgi:hypothetical protein
MMLYGLAGSGDSLVMADDDSFALLWLKMISSGSELGLKVEGQ